MRFADINASVLAIVCRLGLAAFLATGFAKFWLWDEMGRQQCGTYHAIVTWKGIRVCASATQAWAWRAIDIALVAFAAVTVISSLLVNPFELDFARFLEGAADVQAFFKNSEATNFTIEYQSAGDGSATSPDAQYTRALGLM